MSTIERACAITGYRLSDLRGAEKTRTICRARFAVMYAMRSHGLSLPAIGHVLRRHHSTILSGLRRADDYAARDPEFVEMVEAIA